MAKFDPSESTLERPINLPIPLEIENIYDNKNNESNDVETTESHNLEKKP